MSELNAATSMPTESSLVLSHCTVCRLEGSPASFAMCATCRDLMCEDCPWYACSCVGTPHLHAQLKADLRDSALKVGALKAAARQGELSEWQKGRMKTLNAYIDNLTVELHALEDISDQRQQ